MDEWRGVDEKFTFGITIRPDALQRGGNCPRVSTSGPWRAEEGTTRRKTVPPRNLHETASPLCSEAVSAPDRMRRREIGGPPLAYTSRGTDISPQHPRLKRARPVRAFCFLGQQPPGHRQASIEPPSGGFFSSNERHDKWQRTNLVRSQDHLFARRRPPNSSAFRLQRCGGGLLSGRTSRALAGCLLAARSLTAPSCWRGGRPGNEYLPDAPRKTARWP